MCACLYLCAFLDICGCECLCFLSPDLSYILSADRAKSRVGIYKDGNVTVINEIKDFLVIQGEGTSNTVCGNTITFALHVSYSFIQ